jgi:hypothetical protein
VAVGGGVVNWWPVFEELKGCTVPVYVEPNMGEDPYWLRIRCPECDWAAVDPVLDGPGELLAQRRRHRAFAHGIVEGP